MIKNFTVTLSDGKLFLCTIIFIALITIIAFFLNDCLVKLYYKLKNIYLFRDTNYSKNDIISDCSNSDSSTSSDSEYNVDKKILQNKANRNIGFIFNGLIFIVIGIPLFLFLLIWLKTIIIKNRMNII